MRMREAERAVNGKGIHVLVVCVGVDGGRHHGPRVHGDGCRW